MEGISRYNPLFKLPPEIEETIKKKEELIKEKKEVKKKIKPKKFPIAKQIKLDEKLMRRLKEFCDFNGVNANATIRMALNKYLRENGF